MHEVVVIMRNLRNLRIQQQLLARRRDVLGRYLGELDRAAEELESREAEVVDHAAEQWDAQVLTRLSEVDAVSLKRIIGALRRLENGAYGTCEECGVAIEPTRLNVLPEAGNCFDCAADAERAVAIARSA